MLFRHLVLLVILVPGLLSAQGVRLTYCECTAGFIGCSSGFVDVADEDCECCVVPEKPSCCGGATSESDAAKRDEQGCCYAFEVPPLEVELGLDLDDIVIDAALPCVARVESTAPDAPRAEVHRFEQGRAPPGAVVPVALRPGTAPMRV